MAKSPLTKFRKDNDKMSLEAFGRLFRPPVNKSTVLRWESGNIPAERAIDIEARTGISRHLLRPDLFRSSPANTHIEDRASAETDREKVA